MSGNNAGIDGNNKPTLTFISNVDGTSVVDAWGDPTNHRLLVDLSSGSGTVTSISEGTGITLTPSPITTTGSVSIADTAVTPGSYTSASITVDQQGRITAASSGSSGGTGTVTTVSVASANGFTGTVATATTTPVITLTTSINSPVLAGNGTAIAAATTTGSGSTVVLQTSPTLITPVLGVASATTINNYTFTTPATGSTLTIDDGFTLHVTGNVTALSGSSTGTNTGDQTLASLGGANTALSNLASVAINTALLLGTSDGAALGSTSKMWSDLFLASGAVINFNNGNVTLTHSAGVLTLGGTATLALGTNSLTMTGSIAATGARVTKGWFTDVESTNAPTVSGAAVYYTGGPDVAVADGGTGQSSWTQYLIPYADTTTSFSQIAIGTAGQVLTSNGAGSVASFQTPLGGNGALYAVNADELVSTWFTITVPTLSTLGWSTFGSGMSITAKAGGYVAFSNTNVNSGMTTNLAGTGTNEGFIFSDSKAIRLKFRTSLISLGDGDRTGVGICPVNTTAFAAETSTLESIRLVVKRSGSTYTAYGVVGDGSNNHNSSLASFGASGGSVHWNTVEIVATTTSVKFYVNGNLDATISANLPTSSSLQLLAVGSTQTSTFLDMSSQFIMSLEQ